MLLKDGRDTATLSTNELGEMMRNALFNEPGLGCYESFDVKPGWMRLIFDEFAFNMVMERQSGREPDIEADVFEHGKHFKHIDKPIDAAWHWDGDGILAFFVDGRCIINTDCKKRNKWREWEGDGAIKSAIRTVQDVPVLGADRR